MKQNIILDKSFNFSLMIIDLYKLMIGQKEFVLSKQLLRSATSIGANITESTAAQSTSDFIHKVTLASKEARESEYWLKLIDRSRFIETDLTGYLKEIDEIIKILTAIIKTSQKNKLSR